MTRSVQEQWESCPVATNQCTEHECRNGCAVASPYREPPQDKKEIAMPNELLSIEDARNLVADFGKHTLGELAVARQIATAVIEEYGDLPPAMHDHFKENGIWNDDASVQASLATIRLYKPLLDALRPIVYSIENTIVHEGVERICLPTGDLAKLVDTYRGRIG